MNTVVFWKTMKNVRRHRNIKPGATKRAGNCLVLESNDHNIKFFTVNLLAIEMSKTQIHMNKPVSSGLSILDLFKTVMYEFWYDYVKLKCCENVKLCSMDANSFIVHVEKEDAYEDTAEGVDIRFVISNSELDRSFPIEEKVIGLMKDQLGGQTRKEFVGLRTKT